MKKTYIFLIVAALCAIGISARTIHIWRNGIKTDLPIHTNDSITFDETNAPTMHIWRNGSEIYQLALEDNDSITYSKESPVTPTAICFDYDHWREVDTINIYEYNGHLWQTVALPWADEVTTTIPAYYRFPNLESHIDTISHDTVPTWQLAFNTCHNFALDGVHMFGLWNAKSNVMRIYSYLEELPNPNAAYCFYRVESSNAAFIDRDAMTWMPSDTVLHNKGKWTEAALAGVASAPSTLICEFMPVASLKTDGSEKFTPVFPGWVCFDMPFATGTFTVPESGTITFSLEAVQHIDSTGTVKFNLALSGKGEGQTTGVSHSTGNITIPGNKNKKTAGWLTSWGSFGSGLGSAITGGTSASSKNMAAGVVGGITQGIGSALSLIGNCMNANEEAEDKKYPVAFSSKDTMNYDLHFSFNGTITGDFDAQLTSTLASTAKPLTIHYNKFFEGILAHPNPTQAKKARKGNEDSNGNILPLGIWNLKHQPKYYISKEFIWWNEWNNSTDDDRTLVSFLDPTSIELELNMDNPLFDANEIDSIKLIAYDYVFVDGDYNLPAEPYYNFYGVRLDSVKFNGSESIRDRSYKEFLLDTTATYRTITKGDRSYTGVVSDSLSAYGFGMYNMVYSPAINVHNIQRGSSLAVNEISVAVVVEMTFKNGEKRIFAERYLPEIIAYSWWIPDELLNASAPTEINGIPLECPLFDMQRHKALRMLQAERNH